MTDTTGSRPVQALNAQIAQRLFGWEWQRAEKIWQDREGYLWVEADIPAYTTDPAATARVWQWLEQQLGPEDWRITMDYGLGQMTCRLTTFAGSHPFAHGAGRTWPEALCRAALVLAAVLEQEKR